MSDSKAWFRLLREILLAGMIILLGRLPSAIAAESAGAQRYAAQEDAMEFPVITPEEMEMASEEPRLSESYSAEDEQPSGAYAGNLAEHLSPTRYEAPLAGNSDERFEGFFAEEASPKSQFLLSADSGFGDVRAPGSMLFSARSYGVMISYGARDEVGTGLGIFAGYRRSVGDASFRAQGCSFGVDSIAPLADGSSWYLRGSIGVAYDRMEYRVSPPPQALATASAPARPKEETIIRESSPGMAPPRPRAASSPVPAAATGSSSRRKLVTSGWGWSGRLVLGYEVTRAVLGGVNLEAGYVHGGGRIRSGVWVLGLGVGF